MDYINGFLSLVGLLLGFSLASLVTAYFSDDKDDNQKPEKESRPCFVKLCEKFKLELPPYNVKQISIIAFSFFNIALLILFLIVLLYTFPLSKHPILITAVISLISAFTSFISFYFLVLQLSTNKKKSLITSLSLSGGLTGIISLLLAVILLLRLRK